MLGAQPLYPHLRKSRAPQSDASGTQRGKTAADKARAQPLGRGRASPAARELAGAGTKAGTCWGVQRPQLGDARGTHLHRGTSPWGTPGALTRVQQEVEQPPRPQTKQGENSLALGTPLHKASDIPNPALLALGRFTHQGFPTQQEREPCTSRYSMYQRPQTRYRGASCIRVLRHRPSQTKLRGASCTGAPKAAAGCPTPRGAPRTEGPLLTFPRGMQGLLAAVFLVALGVGAGTAQGGQQQERE